MTQKHLPIRQRLKMTTESTETCVFVVSDTHFGHKKLVEMGQRPADFESRIIESWQKSVRAEDIVIHLGDVCIQPARDWNKTILGLPGRKILVRGNHDKKPLIWYLNRGFLFACDTFCWEFHGQRILFSHEPVDAGDFDINMHGHLHDGRHRDIPTGPRHMLLALEIDGYCPHMLKSLLKKHARRSSESA